MFRSALPHGERLVVLSLDGLCQRVSIRAPARGATRGGAVLRGVHAGFDPRSRTGSDAGCPRRLAGSNSFDPRSRTGSDARGIAYLWTISAFRSALPHGERLPRFNRRTKHNETPRFRETIRQATSHRLNTGGDNQLYHINNHKEHPRTVWGSTGRFRVAGRQRPASPSYNDRVL